MPRPARPERRWTVAATLATLAGALTLAAPAIASAAVLAPAPGTLDPTFGTSGFWNADLGGQLAVAGGVAVQPDGRIVTAGMKRMANGQDVVLASRELPDGSPDPTFGQAGIFTQAVGVGSCANTLRLQPDGKIVLAGTGTADGRMAFLALRLLPDGTPDPSFGSDGVATVPIGDAAIANGVGIQRDGRIVLAGTARDVLSDATTNHMAIARLNADGSLDTSYARGGSATFGPNGGAWGLALQGDGKAVLGGERDDLPGRTYLAARVLTDGTLDTRFASRGLATLPVGSEAQGNAVLVQPDGRILITGSAFDGTGVAATVRLRTDGSIDTTFGSQGISEVPLWQAVNGFALQGDGKIVLAATGGVSIRLTALGTPDPSYGTNGTATTFIGTTTAANGVAVQLDGRLVFGGVSIMGDGTMPLTTFRLNASGMRGRDVQEPAVGAPTADTATATTTVTAPSASVAVATLQRALADTALAPGRGLSLSKSRPLSHVKARKSTGHHKRHGKRTKRARARVARHGRAARHVR